MKIVKNIFDEIIAPETLFTAWNEFKRGKRRRPDVMLFERNLEEHIFDLHRALVEKSYRHAPYHGFVVNDPKSREIHKATVRDRVVHHALFLVLNPLFEKTFIYDAYSCRQNKGTHRGIERLRWAVRRVSRNDRVHCLILKCDIRKFFASVDHDILLTILAQHIHDADTMWLLHTLIKSFAPGIPIGNLTSQLFANIYMHPFDQFVKQVLRIPYYIRYTDDFVLVGNNEAQLWQWLGVLRQFLTDNLHLTLHPNKVTLRKYHHGVDFLGYVQRPSHRALRATTRRRMVKKITAGVPEHALHSYLGVLSHADEKRLARHIKHLFWLTSSYQ
ncbi:MAG: reverse transcriptase/maturase family protein [bacterium]|nr:reverse transcriptase/maturase family protein [bacterium]